MSGSVLQPSGALSSLDIDISVAALRCVILRADNSHAGARSGELDSLRAQLMQSSIRVVELAPPGTETPLFRAEFEKEMKGQKGMDVQVLVKQAISGIESGKTEIRPGLSNLLYILSRIAPQIPFGQMSKMLPAAP
jgi:short-subunit dehydrogenase involved in D-alanine esterification of teichoic acids